MALTPAQGYILSRYNAYVSATGIIWYGNGLYTHCMVKTKLGRRLLMSGSELLCFEHWGTDKWVVTPYSRPTLMPTIIVSGEKCYVDEVLLPYSILESLVNYSLNCYEFNDYKRWDMIMDEARRLCGDLNYTPGQITTVEFICSLVFAVVLATLITILIHYGIYGVYGVRATKLNF